jgi:predicted phage terminase large subunit-like protein
MRRVAPSGQLAAAWTLAERWGIRHMTVEGNGFQELVAKPYTRERNQRREDGRYWQLSIEAKDATDDKELRISTLEPDITNGWMLFADHIGPDVLQQFDHFPTGDHDDGPDAIHAAWKSSGGSPVRMETRAAA